MFNFADFIITGLIKSFEEGSLGEGQVYMSASDWFERKRIDDEDMTKLVVAIEAIKAERQRQKEEQENEDMEQLEDELTFEDEEPPEEDEE